MSLSLTCSLPWCHGPLYQRPAVTAGKPSGKLNRRQPAGDGHLGPAGFVPAAFAQVLFAQHGFTWPDQRAHAPSGNRHTQRRAYIVESLCVYFSFGCVCCKVLVSVHGQIERYVAARPDYPALITQAWRFLLVKDQDSKFRGTSTHTTTRLCALGYFLGVAWGGGKVYNSFFQFQAHITRLTLYFTWHYEVLWVCEHTSDLSNCYCSERRLRMFTAAANRQLTLLSLAALKV